MEILEQLRQDRPKIKAAIFDFDGTLSTLRYGWEKVMEPLMLEMITGQKLSAIKKELEWSEPGIINKALEWPEQGVIDNTHEKLVPGIINITLERPESGIIDKAVERSEPGIIDNTLERPLGMINNTLERPLLGIINKTLEKPGSDDIDKALGKRKVDRNLVALVQEVREYIDQSVGIQTYYQMKWLAEAVKRHGRNPSASEDPWWYKAEYNRRLMKDVNQRKESILRGEKTPTDFMIKNSEALLKYLCDRDIKVYVASGTDHADVIKEAEILGLTKYFTEIAGAPSGRVDCSKEAVLQKLLKDSKLKGEELMVAGDGRVEITLGRQAGAITLGVASDEERLSGINFAKRVRLIRAGAHAITGDYCDLHGILRWMGMN